MQRGRTTIIIAHRLNTVKSATKIAAVYRGRILEEVSLNISQQKSILIFSSHGSSFKAMQGSHDELLSLNRYYAYLVKLSQV